MPAKSPNHAATITQVRGLSYMQSVTHASGENPDRYQPLRHGRTAGRACAQYGDPITEQIRPLAIGYPRLRLSVAQLR